MLNNVKIQISNSLLPTVTEEFVTVTDISDLDEVDMAVAECCGLYLDMYANIVQAQHPSLDWEAIAEKCNYIVEEINNYEH